MNSKLFFATVDKDLKDKKITVEQATFFYALFNVLYHRPQHSQKTKLS